MSMKENVLFNIYPEMTPKIDMGGGGILVEKQGFQRSASGCVRKP